MANLKISDLPEDQEKVHLAILGMQQAYGKAGMECFWRLMVDLHWDQMEWHLVEDGSVHLSRVVTKDLSHSPEHIRESQ